jgi:hypothetical protein
MQRLCFKEGIPALKGMATLMPQTCEQHFAPCILYFIIRYSKIKKIKRNIEYPTKPALSLPKGISNVEVVQR